MILIEARDLKKDYKVGKLITNVLKGIDIVIETGDFVSLVGPSGSGKTTLLNVLGGLEKYTSGSVILFGQELKNYTDQEKAKIRSSEIGYVFQFYNLIPNLTVYENVLLASVLGKNKSKENIIKVLAQVGMDEYKHYFPSQLSGGMQQRVAIARCLINDPQVIFADEPIGNLDYNNGIEVMKLFSELNKSLKKTIVMVTHNEESTKYGNRTIHMLDGKVFNDEKHNF